MKIEEILKQLQDIQLELLLLGHPCHLCVVNQGYIKVFVYENPSTLVCDVAFSDDESFDRVNRVNLSVLRAMITNLKHPD